MSKLKHQSCEWAINHVDIYGDTDLFPRLFEIDAIKLYREDCIKLLSKVDVGAYEWNAGRKTIVPKDAFSFRSAIQLDPLDTLFFSALIYEIGSFIETKRLGKDVVFSYRFQPLRDGTMYAANPNWTTFWQRSLSNVRSKGGWVLMTDISNYYNQISHHSIENELIDAKIPQEFVNAIMNLLKHLTQGVSRGIPVGPHAAHLVAECALHSIDRSMVSKGHDFYRYVDDIHIFCKTMVDARIALFDLVETLDAQQRLAIQSHKTRLVSAEEFIKYAERMTPGNYLTQEEQALVTLIRRHSNGDPYGSIQVSTLSTQEKTILTQSNIEKVLNSYVLNEDTNYPHVGWLFRRLAQIGIPIATPYVIEHLEELIPIWGDVGNYILSTKFEVSDDWKPLEKKLLQALQLPLMQHSEYLTVLLLNLYAHFPNLNHTDAILRMYPKRSPMVRREIIRVATSRNAAYWLREQKEHFHSSDPWLKRALIASASAFPKDEREFWLKSLRRNGSDFERIIIRWAEH